MTPLMGFAPDVESTTPGVLVDCAQLIPFESGMEAAPGLTVPTGVGALAAECRGAAVITKLDGTRRVMAGTATALYELVSTTWTDRSAATYTGSSDTRWSFTQFGDATIAANRTDTIQRTTSGSFAAISGAPKAKIVFTVGSFVMALNVNDGAEKPNGWHCCASFDDTDWTEDVATQSASGQLVATPGELTAGARLAEYAVAFKKSSTYLGQYVGAPSVWDWVAVPGDVGCVGQEAVCDIDGALFFVGADNFWVFDGTRPIPVGDDLRQWFADNADATNLYKTKCIYDRRQRRVWVFYPSAGSSSCNSTLVYHLKTKQWGRANRSIEATINYVSAGVTVDTLNTLAATIDALPDIPLDSPFWLAGSSALAVFDTSHQVNTMTGAPAASSFTTGDVGEDDAVTTLQQIRLRFSAGRGPTTASATAYSKMATGDAFAVRQTTQINDGKFDVLQSARWHRAVINMTGSPRVTGIRPQIKGAGKR